jgi:toxin ParE1/3/4
MSYEIAKGAEKDIQSIARYTAQKWGEKQALKYADLLDKCFEEIASGKDSAKKNFVVKEDVWVCRCEKHYVFYKRDLKKQKAIILAVLHERMDLMQRLREKFAL